MHFISGLSVTTSPENPASNNHHRMHPYPPSAAPLVIDHPTSSPPGVDLDAVAAMIHNRGRSAPCPNHATSSSLFCSLVPPDTSNSHQPGNAKPLGRTLAGVLSGAAANLRSKLTHMNTAPELSTPAAASAATTVPPSVQHHQQHHQGQPQQQQVRQQQQRRISSTSNGGGGAAVMNGVEQSPAAIPVTVPGADLSKHAYSELHPTSDAHSQC